MCYELVAASAAPNGCRGRPASASEGPAAGRWRLRAAGTGRRKRQGAAGQVQGARKRGHYIEADRTYLPSSVLVARRKVLGYMEAEKNAKRTPQRLAGPRKERPAAPTASREGGGFSVGEEETGGLGFPTEGGYQGGSIVACMILLFIMRCGCFHR